MSQRRTGVVILAFCALLTASCGRSNGLYPVHGTVLYQGAPAAGATVSFIRKGGDRMHDPAPQGVAGEDGTFALVGPTGDGAAPGEYIVLVEWKVGAGTQRGRAPALSAPDRLNGRYLDFNRPLLSAEVKPSPNNLSPFELN